MKKNKLYTVNKYNKVAFMPDERINLFDEGGDTEVEVDDDSKGGWFGLKKSVNPFSKVNINNTLNGVATAASPLIRSAMSNGYSTGIGNGIANVGNAVGDFLPGPWKWGVKLGTAVFGGIYNAAMGVKYNEDVINGIKDNAASMESAGNALAQANTNAGVLDAARNMGSTVDIDYHDLGSTGFLRTNNALRREKARLDKAQNLAMAKQTHGLMLGANQADQTVDDLANSTFIAAYGGQLDSKYNKTNKYANGGLLNNADNNMGAIEYGLAVDDIIARNTRSDAMANLPEIVLGRGGRIHIDPKNKGKFNTTKKRTGKTTEELTHSKNPLTRKRAIFAQNAKRWSHKHDEGGPLNIFDDGGRKWVTSVGTVGPGGFVPSRLGGYSGGIGGGGGAGTIISDVPEYNTTVENDTIWLPITRNFNQAWREAVRNGQDTLIFDGGKYPIEYSDNPNWEPAGNAREEIIDLVPIITEKKKTEKKKAEGGPLTNPLLLRYPELPLPDLQAMSISQYSNEPLIIEDRKPIKYVPIEEVVGDSLYPAATNRTLGELSLEAIAKNKLERERLAEFNRQVNQQNTPLFAFGGNLETNGADWPTRLTHIDAGQSHELNPNGGVQVGVDSEGTPNLVEEKETIWNDYVFSNRIFLDDSAKELFHIGKKKDYTYAEYSKKLEKEAAERPNDAISRRGLEIQMEDLMQQQERQKAEMEAEEAEEAFDALAPEEKVAVMQDVAAQEQAAQEAAMQEQAMARQQSVPQQVSPEEAAMLQQQMAQEQQMMQAEPQMGQQPMMAYGGNLFAKGGKKDIINIVKKKRREGTSFIDWLKNIFYDRWVKDNEFEKLGIAVGNMGTAIGNAALGRTVDVGNAVGNNLLQGISTAANNIKDTYYNALPWLERDYSDEEIAQMIEEEIARREKNNESVTEFLKEVYGEPVSVQKIDKNKKKEKTFEPNYLDFSSIPDDHDPSVGSTPYTSKNDRNSTLDFKTAVANFKKVGVSPSDEEKVQHIIDNLTEDEKQQFLSLTDPKEQAAVIINAYKRLEVQNSNNAASNAASANSAKTNQAANTQQKQQTPPKAQSTQAPAQRTTAGSSTYRNVGKLKEDPQTAWRDYVLPGLNKFIDSWEDRINNAATQGEKDALIDQMVSDFNGLQKSYNDYVWPNIGKSGYYYDPNVENHQKDFSRNYGNTGFFVAQPDGTIVDAIGQAVDKAGSMGDNPDDGGIDGYNGPNTAMRNFGATMYGDADFYKPIIDKFRNLGVDYKLSEDLKNGNDALYVLSRRTPKTSAPAALTPNSREELQGVLNSVRTPIDASATIGSKAPATITPEEDDTTRKIVPILKPETNLGMYGPLVTLGMQVAGIGKPDYSGLDKARAIADSGAAIATYQPIGDYIRYSPMDIWAAQNRADANARATDRYIMNNSSPWATKMAGLIAANYADQLGRGEIFRQSQEYNDNLKKLAAEFNRGTNIQNANAFNQLSQFNTGQRNADRQFRAQMAMQDAKERMDADAGWYNSLYGNISDFTANLAAKEKETKDRNTIAKIYAAGLAGKIDPDNPLVKGLIGYSTAKGGKLKRKKNRGIHLK